MIAPSKSLLPEASMFIVSSTSGDEDESVKDACGGCFASFTVIVNVVVSVVPSSSVTVRETV